MMSTLKEDLEDILILYGWMSEYEFTKDEIIDAIAWEYEMDTEFIRRLLDETLEC